MKAIEINRHLNSLFPDTKEDTVDRVIYGDPDVEVEGIAVAWMPYAASLERAREMGANVLVTHEPTFYSHRDLDDDNAAGMKETAEKRRWLDDAGMTVIRCHDVWDALPEIGIPFAWGAFLGLNEVQHQERYYNIYRVPEQSAEKFARQVADRVKSLGQESVGFYGEADRTIRSVGVGTGCISQPFKLYELGADLAVSVDDIIRCWVAGERCEDTGRPLVVVNHCVSEEPGIVVLSDYLKEAYPGTAVTHMPQRCTYRTIR